MLWKNTTYMQVSSMVLRMSLISPAASHDAFNSGSIPEVGRTRRVSGYHTEVTSGGGLSVTGCLNNFSMFIFHPYGGMTKKTSFTSLENTFRKGTNHLEQDNQRLRCLTRYYASLTSLRIFLTSLRFFSS